MNEVTLSDPVQNLPGRDDPVFSLRLPNAWLTGHGVDRTLPVGNLATLASRVGAFFAGQSAQQPGLLVGAIPYARAATDAIFSPERIAQATALQPENTHIRRQTRGILRPEPSPQAWMAAVRAALVRIADPSRLEKVVLSRSIVLTANEDLDLAPILAELAKDPAAAVFSVPLPTGRRLIGASPELLISRRGRQVASHPLAGSARRPRDPQADRAAGEALLASDKDRREHAMVSESVLDTLAPYCDALGAPFGTTLFATASMWHLGTRIEGRLRDPDTPVAALLAELHPTPAVCGLPRDLADAVLMDLEGYDRGFYAGAVGWMDAQGDGDWYVALRCAEVGGRDARLYAGAGIVSGSSPEAETAETAAKFLAMLRAFGVDEEDTA